MNDVDIDMPELGEILTPLPAPTDGPERARRTVRRRRSIRIGAATAAAVAVVVAGVSAIGGPGDDNVVAGPGEVDLAHVFSLRPVETTNPPPCAPDAFEATDDTVCYSLGGPVVTAADVESARATGDQDRWGVEVTLTTSGSRALNDYARGHFQEQLAIVVDGEVTSAPTIESREFGGRLHIAGDFSKEEAQAVAEAISRGNAKTPRETKAAVSRRDEASYQRACTTAIAELRDGREVYTSATPSRLEDLKEFARRSGSELPPAAMAADADQVLLCLTQPVPPVTKRCDDDEFVVESRTRLVLLDGTLLGDYEFMPERCPARQE